MIRCVLRVFVAVSIAACWLGCADRQGPQRVDTRVAEAWVSQPKTDWPQIVLTNEAEFIGHDSLYGASSFLVETQDGRVLAATAAHLIGPAGGVEPEIPVRQLTRTIRSWRMFPRTMPDDFVEVTALAVPGLAERNLDWLVLSIEDMHPLPALPLKVHSEPVQVGDTVYLIGCPYCEGDCKQNVYAGKVTKRRGGRFRYDLDPPVNIRGFSGAPIVDRKGYLVGVMTVWFNPKTSGDDYLEAGGEDAASIYDMLNPTR